MKLLFTFSLFFIFSFSFAQNPIPTWGKLSSEEHNLKIVKYDSSASAVVLGHWGDMSVGFGSITIYYVKRIKILDKRGLDYGNVSIPYYSKNDLEFVRDIEAHTISPDGTVKEVTKKSIFDEKLNEYYRQAKIIFPAVEVGSVIEYKYTLQSKNYFSLESWKFQSEIPTLYSDLKAAFLTNQIAYSYGLRGAKLYEKYFNAKENKDLRWFLSDLPALIDEPFVANNKDYSERIDFQLLEYANFNTGSVVKVATTWDKVAEQMNDIYQPYLNKKGVAKDILSTILAPNDTPKDKIRKIYNYVNNAYTWNDFYGFGVKSTLNTLVSDKKGLASEINLLLTLLLREAGFEAYPALYSTRKNGKPVVDFPIVDNFNALGCGLKFENRFYLLNATDNFRPYTLPALQDLNFQCFLITAPRKGEWVKIEVPRISKQVVSVNADLSTKTPSINVNISYDGYEAILLRKMYAKLGENDFKNSFKQMTISDWELKEIKIEDIADVDKMAVVKLTYQPESAINNNLIYFKPVLLKYFTKNPYVGNIRRLPIEIDYPTLYRYILNLKMPEGYKTEGLPKDEGIKLPQDGAVFTYNVNLQENNSIQLVTGFQLRNSNFQAEFFPYLKSIYDSALSKWDEMIVLKKK